MAFDAPQPSLRQPGRAGAAAPLPPPRLSPCLAGGRAQTMAIPTPGAGRSSAHGYARTTEHVLLSPPCSSAASQPRAGANSGSTGLLVSPPGLRLPTPTAGTAGLRTGREGAAACSSLG